MGKVDISPTVEWKKVHGRIKITAKLQPLYFSYEGEGAIDFLDFEIW